nr:hypothetical protein Q903MT_gene6618 [Picea sitchensis]
MPCYSVGPDLHHFCTSRNSPISNHTYPCLIILNPSRIRKKLFSRCKQVVVCKVGGCHLTRTPIMAHDLA